MDTNAIVVKDTDERLDRLKYAPFRGSLSKEKIKPRINVGSWKSEKERLEVTSVTLLSKIGYDPKKQVLCIFPFFD